MPLAIEPIACSRIPNAMLRPAWPAEKTPPPSMIGLRRLDEVGGAADHRRRVLADRVQHLPPGVAGGDLLAGLEPRQRVEPAGARPAQVIRVPVLAELGEGAAHACESPVPLALELGAPLGDDGHVLATWSGTWNVTSGSQPRRSFVARTSASPSGLPCALAVSCAWRRRVGDVAAEHDQRGPLASRRARLQRCRDRVHVLRVVDVLDVPAVRLEAGALVLGREGQRGRAVDRDVVVVVDVDERAEAEVARDRRCLLRDAFHQVAVGADA